MTKTPETPKTSAGQGNKASRPRAGSGSLSRSRRAQWLGLSVVAVVALGISVWAVIGQDAPNASSTPKFGYEVTQEYPHDPKAYTQGLVFADGELYEGTGLYRQSSIRRVDLETGKPLQVQQLNPRLFGEGITYFDGKLYQLTWKNNVGLIIDPKTFELLGNFRYTGEGWGLTHDGEHLILSDGTANLRFLNPKTFRVAKRLQVRDQGKLVRDLNELEYIDGVIYANVWQSDLIARISPEDGRVLSWIDLSGLLDPRLRRDDQAVLNGIAWDADEQRLLVTGKLWPKLFEIKVKE